MRGPQGQGGQATAGGGTSLSLTLKQIMEMQDQPVSSTTDQLAREFLEVFEPGKPLDKEGFRGLDTTSQH